ncbi:hypothetical protein TCAL_16699 [Tigriopus californicus]|uniref:Uncharacterized protein n=1 Tax=Tigriopus californicus TaxID=6832 RepID=A0A553PM30_TIGCA|nr:hypothetical protein TCAL_16699 [Tigriopus californicus]
MDEIVDVHNLDSSPDSADLEEQILSEAIGTTLYSKHWVLSSVLELSQVKNSSDLADDLDAKMASLVDMSVEPDVCRFLQQIGAFQIFLSHLVTNPQCSRSQELIMCLLANSVHVSDLSCCVFIQDTSYVLVAQNILLRSSSVDVIKSVFVFLNAFLGQAIALDEPELMGLDLFLAEEFVQVVSYLLNASVNVQLLHELVKFLLHFFEAAFETREDFMESRYFSSEFLLSVREAFQQVLSDAKVSFLFLELLGQVSKESNLANNGQLILDTLTDYAKAGDESLEVGAIGTIGKICSIAWSIGPHEASFTFMKQISLRLKDTHPNNANEEALGCIVSQILNDYEKRYPPQGSS